MIQKEISFPIDESKHRTTTEWWYLNGHLEDKKGDRYSYMSTLFRVRFPAVLGGPFKYLPSTDKYFHHSIVTNLKTEKYVARVEIADVSKKSFADNKMVMGWNTNHDASSYLLEKEKERTYLAKSPDFRLSLFSTKEPLLVGQSGFVNNVGEETYYYSLSSLDTTGKLNLESSEIDVSGKSWMDHQWGDFGAPKGYWNWFCAQLDGGIELICYESGGEKGKKILATICYANGEQKSFSDISIKPGKEVWISPKTKARYPLHWKITVPEISLDLEVRALVPDHELNFWYINYWEGPSKITGTLGKTKIYGKGFIELVGRHSKIRRYGPLASFFLGQLQKNKYLK